MSASVSVPPYCPLQFRVTNIVPAIQETKHCRGVMDDITLVVPCLPEANNVLQLRCWR